MGKSAAVRKVNPDAELLELGMEFDRCFAAERKAKPADEARGDWTDWNAAYYKTADVVQRIEAIPPQTLDGAMVKVRALVWCHGGRFDGLEGQKSTDMRLGNQVLTFLAEIWG